MSLWLALFLIKWQFLGLLLAYLLIWVGIKLTRQSLNTLDGTFLILRLPIFRGKDQGCGWATGRCETTWTGDGYFCSQAQSGRRTCTADRTAKGICSVFNYGSALDPQFQHFSSASLGGSSASADFCSFTEGSTFCADVSVSPLASIQEEFGPNSIW